MTTSTIGFFAAVVLSAGTLAAQSQSDPETLKLLRQTIADQKKYPDRVIRTYTSLPPDEVKSAAPPSRPAPASRPTPASGPTSEAAPPSEAAPTLVIVAQAKPAPESKPAPPPASTPAEKKAAAAELERQFLNGKLSERKYKKALAELDNPSKPAAVQPTPQPKPAPPAPAPQQPPPKPSPEKVVVAPAPPTAPPQPAANQKSVSEVEARIEEMIRQKEARERAAKTNAPPAAGVKPTKRERLDFLLRQVVDGKLSDAEYKKEREKILAEPE